MARTVGEDNEDNENGEEEVIDVETSGDTVSIIKKLNNLIMDFCDKGNAIKAVLCSSLSQTSLENISVNDICSQGKTKVKKEFLANSVLSLLSIAESITPIMIGNNKELELEALASKITDKKLASTDPNDLTKLAGNINRQIKIIDARLKSANLEFANSTKVLTELLTSLENARNQKTASFEQVSAMKPNTISPHQMPVNNKTPCDPYASFSNDAISKEMRHDLLKFAKSQSFSTQETCDIIYYGEYGYHCTGGRYEAKPLPPTLINLLKHVQPMTTTPNMSFNSCIITRYQDGSKYSPHHSEVEPVIDPQSVIMNIYISE